MNVLFLIIGLSFAIASAQTTRFTRLSRTLDIVLDKGSCETDEKCGPISLTVFKKGRKRSVQQLVAGKVAKSDLEDHPIQFMDVNFDGIKDLAVTDGFRAPAGLGITALRIYLYSPKMRDFVYNSELSEISQSESISGDTLDRKRKQVVTYARPGGGYFRWRGYSMATNRPVLVSEITEDATIEQGKRTLLTTRKLINGRWRTWTRRYKGFLNL